MSSIQYVAPQWQYHHGAPKGKRMRLLCIDEARLADNLLRRHVKHSNVLLNKGRYQSQFIEHFDYADKIWRSVLIYLRKIVSIPANAVQHNDMDALNQELNLIFSDDGWRWIRKEISQSKKRLNKARMEVSSDLVDRLKLVMVREQLNSFDEVLDYLISSDMDRLHEA